MLKILRTGMALAIFLISTVAAAEVLTLDFRNTHSISAMKRGGHLVIFRLQDQRYSKGYREVQGYIYDFVQESGRPVPLSSYLKTLSLSDQRKTVRNLGVTGETKYVPNKSFFVVTSIRPQYEEDNSSGYTRWISKGWLREPSDLQSIKMEKVQSAFFFSR